MPSEQAHTLELIDLWSRQPVADAVDAERALVLTRHVEEEHRSTQRLQALAWRLAERAHASLGREIPAKLSLCRCKSAAASISHRSREVLDIISTQVVRHDGPLCLLGSLGSSRSLFDAWDVLAGATGLLIPLNGDTAVLGRVADFGAARGLRGISPTRLAEHLLAGSREVPLNGGTVHVPLPEVLVALTSPLVTAQPSIDSLIFCTAARQAVDRGAWQHAEEICRRLGKNGSPMQAVLKIGIEHWLGLQVPAVARLSGAVRRFLEHA